MIGVSFLTATIKMIFYNVREVSYYTCGFFLKLLRILGKENYLQILMIMIIAKITKQSKVKAIKGYKWHPKEKHWSFPYSDGVIDRILSIFKGEKNELDPTLQVTKKSLKTEINFEDLRRDSPSGSTAPRRFYMTF